MVCHWIRCSIIISKHYIQLVIFMRWNKNFNYQPPDWRDKDESLYLSLLSHPAFFLPLTRSCHSRWPFTGSPSISPPSFHFIHFFPHQSPLIRSTVPFFFLSSQLFLHFFSSPSPFSLPLFLSWLSHGFVSHIQIQVMPFSRSLPWFGDWFMIWFWIGAVGGSKPLLSYWFGLVIRFSDTLFNFFCCCGDFCARIYCSDAFYAQICCESCCSKAIGEHIWGLHGLGRSILAVMPLEFFRSGNFSAYIFNICSPRFDLYMLHT